MQVLLILIPVFLVIFTGYFLVRIGLFKPKDSYIFSRYSFYVGMPVLLFRSISMTEFQAISDPSFLALNIINLLIVMGFTMLVCFVAHIPKKLWGILLLAAAWGNVAYMGIPVNEQLFGDIGVSTASMVVGVSNIVMVGVGIFFLSYFSHTTFSLKKIGKDFVTSPILLSIFFGVIFSAFKITIPETIDIFLAMFARSAAPIALFAIGAFMAGKKWLAGDFDLIVLISSFNLILLPIVTFIMGFLFFTLNPITLMVSTVESAMPIAASAFVFAQQYKVCEKEVSSGIILSTLLSIVTLTLFIWVVNVIPH